MDGITPDCILRSCSDMVADAINELTPLFIKHNNTFSVAGPVLGTAGATERVGHIRALKEHTI